MSPVEYTSIELFGILFEEPMTAATDLLTASVCLFAFLKLRQQSRTDAAFRYYYHYFLFMALGTACAAFLSHAILYWSGYNWKTLGWTFSAIGIFCIENSALHFYENTTQNKKWHWLFIFFKIKLALFVACLAFPMTRVFETVQINSTIGIAGIVFPIFAFLFWKTRRKSFQLVVLGLGLSFVTGLVFNAEITFHKYFNYHDLGHVLMASASLVLYFAGVQLTKETPLQNV